MFSSFLALDKLHGWYFLLLCKTVLKLCSPHIFSLKTCYGNTLYITDYTPQVICKLLISGLHRHLLLPAHDHFSTGSAPKSARPLEVNVVRGALGGEAAVADGEVARLAEVLRLLDHWGRTRQPGWRRRWWRRRWRWRWWSLLLLLY